MIHKSLIPALKRKFADLNVEFNVPPQPIAIFPPLQQAVGRVLIYDDGDEVTVLIQNITHHHIEADQALPPNERDRAVTEDVIDFLDALFNDQVLLLATEDNRIGGWHRLDLEQGPIESLPSMRYFLWSRPYEP